jgi:predicted HTH domain antitoxin
LGVPDLAAVRVALAASLFRSGSISAGFAARMADKSLAEMLDLLSAMGIPLGGTKADVQEDMATARKWLDTRS